MKKILIRADMTPYDAYTPGEVILYNKIGENAGNLIYAYGAIRTLTTEDCQVDIDHYLLQSSVLPQEDIDRINETCSAYVLPLADAFRDTYMGSLSCLTKNIRRLKIPVIILGVGIRIPPGGSITDGYPFDEPAREFITAVMEKSALVGVRGEITRDYLLHLGLPADKIEVIGCPSMYTNGPELHIRDLHLTRESFLIVNETRQAPKRVHQFMRHVMDEFPNYCFIPQLVRELRELYLGAPYLAKGTKTGYPSHITDPIFTSGRARFFLNAPQWEQFAATADFCVGPRIHGNIASVVAGTPSLVITKDARMQELADFHQLAFVPGSTVGKSTDLLELAAKADFKKAERCHPENFRNYVRFLDANGLDHIFKDGNNPLDTPLDRLVADAVLPDPVVPICTIPLEEMYARWQDYFPKEQIYRLDLKDQKSELRRELSEQKKIVSTQKKENEKLQKELDASRKRTAKLEAEVRKTLYYKAKQAYHKVKKK